MFTTLMWFSRFLQESPHFVTNTLEILYRNDPGSRTETAAIRQGPVFTGGARADEHC
jgi:hypothetical protein